MTSRLALFASWLIAIFSTNTAAQDYPAKPVRLIVPFAAGGPTDRVARDLAEAIRKPLGAMSVVIDNVGGAGGTLGAAKAARSAPDGHTLFLHHVGMSTSPALYRKLPYDTMGDFEFLGMINEVPMTLVGRNSLPANNFKELLTWINANKGKINLGNAGLGAASHLCGLLFQSALKIDMTTVPYKGTGPAMTDLLGGHVEAMIASAGLVMTNVRNGRLTVLAVTSRERSPLVPGVPAVSEFVPRFEAQSWVGILAPAGTPRDRIDRIYKAALTAIQNPEIRTKFQGINAEPVGSSPDEFAQVLKDTEATMSKLINQLGLFGKFES